MQKGKAFIFSAPSGSGKTTIVRHLLNTFPSLSFSVSACTRPQRPQEIDGRDYYFMSPDEFRQKISEDAFVEWEEVYEGKYYGTLKSEIERIWSQGKHVIFDVDVRGGASLKKYFGNRALAVFVRVPDLEVLRNRLMERKTESEDSFRQRIAKAAYELTYEKEFDVSLVNNQLEDTLKEAEQLYQRFIRDGVYAFTR
ncbi:MAG: guanylate kinase [Cyclobacteriaceae bacterium]